MYLTKEEFEFEMKRLGVEYKIEKEDEFMYLKAFTLAKELMDTNPVEKVKALCFTIKRDHTLIETSSKVRFKDGVKEIRFFGVDIIKFEIGKFGKEFKCNLYGSGLTSKAVVDTINVKTNYLKAKGAKNK